MQAAAAYHGTTSHRPNGTCRRQRRTVEVQVILKGNVMRIGETLVAAQWVFALVPSGHKTSHQLESLLHRRQLWHLRWQSSGEAPEPSGSPCLCKGIALLLQLRTPHPRVAAACFLDISFTSKQETQSFASGFLRWFPLAIRRHTNSNRSCAEGNSGVCVGEALARRPTRAEGFVFAKAFYF